jgi:hypothetical protein
VDRAIDRLAPLAVLAGAVALLVSLFLRYYEVPHGGSTFTGWETFSKADILLAIAAAAGAAAVALALVTRARWPYIGAALAGALAAAVLVYVADRPPAASLEKTAASGAHGASTLVLAYGAFVGIAGALVLALGAVWAASLVDSPAPAAAASPPAAPPPPAP